MLGFWIIFGLFGLMFVPLIITFLICGIDLKHKLSGTIVVLLLWLLLAGGITLDGISKSDSWNGGYCNCGTHWELRGVTKSRIGTETKYYVCPNCYSEISK